MQIELKAPKIWLASEPVDLRKSINGLSAIVLQHFKQRLDNHIYVFYNRSKTKLKLLAYHRNGAMLIYKQLDRRKFTLHTDDKLLCEITAQQLSWLVAGLDWVNMSAFDELIYDDYF